MIPDIDGFNSAFEANRNNPAVLSFVPNFTTDDTRDYEAEEDIYAGYGLVTHKGDKHFLLAGVRYERTDFSSSGRTRFRDGGVDEFRDVSNSGDYGELLPSINYSYWLTNDLKLHSAYSKSLSRPRFLDFVARGEDVRVDLANGDITVTRGNPDLQPRKADNLDLSLEWYLEGGQGLLSAGLFYKVIEDEFFQTTEDGPFTSEGITDPEAQIRQFRNLEDDVTILGLELGHIQNLDFLPEPFDGLSLNVNATWLDTEIKVPTGNDNLPIRTLDGLTRQPDKIFNASLGYDNGPWSGRLAYNFTGDQLRSINDDEPERDRTILSRDKVDLRFSYQATERLQISFEGQNLTDTGRRENIGLNQELTQTGIADFGRAYFIGVTYTNR